MEKEASFAQKVFEYNWLKKIIIIRLLEWERLWDVGVEHSIN